MLLRHLQKCLKTETIYIKDLAPVPHSFRLALSAALAISPGYLKLTVSTSPHSFFALVSSSRPLLHLHCNEVHQSLVGSLVKVM